MGGFDSHTLPPTITITSPEGVQFWPVQSQKLFDMVGSRSEWLVPFTAEEGASRHCEPLAPLLRDLRIFEALKVLAQS